jgi:hypothetical protein
MTPGGDAIAFGVVIVIPALLLVLGVQVGLQRSKQRHEERLRLIERGVLSPPVMRSDHIRLWGIVLVALGIGWALATVSFGAFTNDRDMMGFAAGGVIPLLVGVGVLLDYRLLTKDLLKQRAHNREQESQHAEHSQAQ